MKTCHSAGYFKQLILFLLLSLMTVFVFSGNALALAPDNHTIDRCSDCHGNRTTGDVRPQDNTYRNITSGAFVGSHSTHMAAGTTTASCEHCHPRVTTFGHRDGKINLQTNINKNSSTAPATGLYVKAGGAAFVNQTSNPAMTNGALTNGNCSNVNCHFQKTSPNWGSTPLFKFTTSTDNDCDKCHGTSGVSSAPQDRSHPGTGSKHGVYYTGTDSCAKCHPNHTTFSHATSVGRSLILNGSDMTSASYSKSATNLAYSTYMTNADANRNGTCSNLYCHSDGTTVAGTVQNQIPTWGGSGTCALCHKDGASGLATPAGGYGHGKHIVAGISSAIGCVKCHAATVSNNTTISSYSDHVDKSVSIKFNNSTTAVNGIYNGVNASVAVYKKGINTSRGTCQNVYCHSNGTTATGPFKSMSTARWGSPLTARANNCASCHGGDATNPRFRNMSTGKHWKHVVGYSYKYACSECHATTASGNSTIGTPANHVNSKVDVAFSATWGGSYTSSSFAPGVDVNRTCSATYCHSNGQTGVNQVFINMTGTRTWYGSRGSLGCSFCHGSTSARTTSLSGKHAAHLSTTVNPSLGTAFACNDCHANGGSNNNRINHVNKLINYSGAKAGKYTGVSPVNCANFYCHSNGKGGYKSMAAAGWGSATTLNCDGCHGSESGQPALAAGAPNYVAGNSHGKHVAQASDCYRCHKTTTVDGANIITGTTAHVDKVIDVRFSKVNAFTTYSGLYNPAKTCSATYCHGGANTTDAWGTTGTINCSSCHDAAANGSAWTASSAHKLHYQSTVLPTKFGNMSGNVSNLTLYRFTCSSCHDPRPGKASHAGGAQDTNRAAEVFFGFSTAGHSPVYVQGASLGGTNRGFNFTNGSSSCNATYCHSNGQSGANFASGAAVSWTTTASSVTCDKCHGNTTTTTLSPLHYKHMNNAANGGNFGCVDCHATTVSGNLALKDKSKHVNKFIDYSGAYAGKNRNCSNFYCHSDGKGTFKNPSTWAAATQIDCGGCHGNTPATLVTGLHAKHLSANADCFNCHNGTTNAANTISGTTHINRVTNDVTGGGLYKTLASVNFGYVGTSCSNINCHSMGKFSNPASVTWATGNTLGCNGCHPNLSGAHARHTGNLISSVTFYNYTANISAGTDTDDTALGKANYGFGCANCHPVDLNRHLDGNVDVALGTVENILGVNVDVTARTSTLRKKNTSASTTGAIGTGVLQCQNVYCHSDGQGGSTLTARWSETYAGLGVDRCKQCHGNSPTSVGAHAAHVVGIHSDDIYNGTSGKLVPGTSGSVSHGLAAQATTLNCDICHATTVANNRNVLNSNCNSCHNGDAGNNRMPRLNVANHVRGGAVVSFKSVNFVSKAQLRPGSFVNYTGGVAGWKRNQVANVDQYKTDANAFDYAKNPLNGTVVFTPGASPGLGSCANVVCHNMKAGQSVQWNTTLTCDSCHTAL